MRKTELSVCWNSPGKYARHGQKGQGCLEQKRTVTTNFELNDQLEGVLNSMYMQIDRLRAIVNTLPEYSVSTRSVVRTKNVVQKLVELRDEIERKEYIS